MSIPAISHLLDETRDMFENLRGRNIELQKQNIEIAATARLQQEENDRLMVDKNQGRAHLVSGDYFTHDESGAKFTLFADGLETRISRHHNVSANPAHDNIDVAGETVLKKPGAVFYCKLPEGDMKCDCPACSTFAANMSDTPDFDYLAHLEQRLEMPRKKSEPPEAECVTCFKGLTSLEFHVGADRCFRCIGSGCYDHEAFTKALAAEAKPECSCKINLEFEKALSFEEGHNEGKIDGRSEEHRHLRDEVAALEADLRVLKLKIKNQAKEIVRLEALRAGHSHYCAQNPPSYGCLCPGVKK